MTSERAAEFEESYTAGVAAPWDIGRPQAAFAELAESGELHGRVLDVGCGTGEHALAAASIGLEAFGVDVAPTAIRLAKEKAAKRGLVVQFVEHDALDLASIGKTFETVLDCGLFHTFGDDERKEFVESLASVTVAGAKYHMLCFSDAEPGEWGPRRVTKGEIEASFADGWRVDSIERANLEITIEPGSVEAWLCSILRV